MRIEDTAGNIHIKADTCDCRLTGGCEKCKGVFISKSKDYYCFSPYYIPNINIDYFQIFEQIRYPNCGKVLEPHICEKGD